MKGGRQETTYVGCEDKLGSNRRIHASGTTKKARENRGPRGHSLWTAQTGRAAKPRIRPVSLNSMGRYAEKKKKSGQEKQDLLVAKPGRMSVSLDRRGRGAEKNSKTYWSRGIDPLATKLKRSPTRGSPWRQVQPNKKVGENRQMGWRVQHGSTNVGPKGTLNVKPMVDNVRPHHCSNSWNAPLLSRWD